MPKRESLGESYSYFFLPGFPCDFFGAGLAAFAGFAGAFFTGADFAGAFVEAFGLGAGLVLATGLCGVAFAAPCCRRLDRSQSEQAVEG